jgi:branched-chain amino acid transport system substrate-binding protein
VRCRFRSLARPRFPAGLALCALALTAAAAERQEPNDAVEPSRPAPFLDWRTHDSRYVGPPGKRLAPDEVDQVLIGYFGPFDPEDPRYGRVWQAAQRAIAEANDRGGFHGKPFRLVPAWSEDPWGSGVSQLAQLVYRDHVWAVIGGVDGPSTHLAEQIVVKARLPLVSPISTDKTVNLANVPWMFSLAPGDHLIAPVLAGGIEQYVGSAPWVLLTANDHDSFLFARELRKALTDRELHPRYEFVYDPAAVGDREPLIGKCLAPEPRAIIVIADPDQSALLVRRLRETGFDGCIIGGPAMGRDVFIAQVGELAGLLLFPMMTEVPDRAAACAQNRHDDSDDYAVLLTYDAVSLVVRAIREAGLNRADIKTALRDHSPVRGVSGGIAWDGLGTNTRSPGLGTLREGKVVPWDAEAAARAADSSRSPR